MKNKNQIIANVAEKANVSKKVATDVVNAFLSSVTEELASGESVQMIGFGSFVVKEKAARQYRNLRTGEMIDAPATKVPAFKAGAQLKAAVKGDK